MLWGKCSLFFILMNSTVLLYDLLWPEGASAMSITVGAEVSDGWMLGRSGLAYQNSPMG